MHAAQVAIVGLGPVGALLANLLGQAGIRVTVVERDAQIYPLPRAIHFDGEIMRVFQATGLKQEVEAICRPGLNGMQFVNAQGETLLIRGGTSALGMHGCANNYYFHQPQLEAVLRAGLRRFSNVTLLTESTVTSVQQDSQSVTLQIADQRAEGIGAGVSTPYELQADYVIGCDGARSIVRKAIGSTQQDLGLHQEWLVFDVILNHELAHLPNHTVQHCDPVRPMTYCYVTGLRRRWEIMLMPGDDPQHLTQEARLWELISPWLRPDQARIERAVIYTFHSVIAQTWRQQRLLIAGDSAHQMPPFLGQGFCSGARDAANLAWKLIAILQQGASDRLLDSYEIERAPHVKAFVELAVRLGNIIQTTDTHQAALRDAKFKAGQPEVFQFPTPGLGGMAAPLGQSFAQANLASVVDAQQAEPLWADDMIGYHFAVIARAEIAQALQAPAQSHAVRVFEANNRPWHDWLNEHNCDAVLVRPDRYIQAIAEGLPQSLALLSLVP